MKGAIRDPEGRPGLLELDVDDGEKLEVQVRHESHEEDEDGKILDESGKHFFYKFIRRNGL